MKNKEMYKAMWDSDMEASTVMAIRERLESSSSAGSPDYQYPKIITQEMVKFARTESDWHTAANLNAMLELGYCPKCGMVPIGCEREGCRAKAKLKENSNIKES